MQEVHVGAAVRLTVSGELDLATADAFAERLQSLTATGSKVTLDLSEVDFMDSVGLTALVGTISEARHANQEIEVAPQLAPQVARLLHITGVTTIVNAV